MFYHLIFQCFNLRFYLSLSHHSHLFTLSILKDLGHSRVLDQLDVVLRVLPLYERECCVLLALYRYLL